MIEIAFTLAVGTLFLLSLAYVMFWAGVNHEHRRSTRPWARRALTAEAIAQILACALIEGPDFDEAALSPEEAAVFEEAVRQFGSEG
jgi:hypothetical protein